MSNRLLTTLKKYIRLNLEDKIYGIMNDKDKVRFLSKNDFIKLMKYMRKINKHSLRILEHIYIRSSLDIYDLDNTFLMKKCYSGELNIVKFLFQLPYEIRILYKIDPSADKGIVISYACQCGHIEIVKFLLSDEIRALYPKIDPSTDCNYAIRLACEEGHLDLAKFLLSDEIRSLYPKIDPSASSNYALKNASGNGHIKVVRFLLSDEIRLLFPQIDPSSDNNMSIRWAVGSNSIGIVKLLLQDQRVIDKGLNSAIDIATRGGMKDILDLLLSIDKNKK